MSYDMIMVREEVKNRCEVEKLDIGFLLENDPDSLAPLDTDEIEIAKNELLSSDCNFILESDENNVLEFIHKYKPSAKVVIRERYIFFSSGFESNWSIIHATMVVMEISNYKLRRYDFQDGGWC